MTAHVCCPITYTAGGAEVDVIESGTPAIGETITEAIWITNAQNLGGFEFALEYDAAVLEYSGMVRGDLLLDTGRPVTALTPITDSGAVVLGAYSQGSAPGAHGNGLLAEVTFAVTGTGDSELTIQDVLLANVTGTVTVPGVEQPCTTLADLGISGRTSGETATAYQFTAVVTPAAATPPLTYTWAPAPDSGQGMAVVSYTWATTGTYLITLTATNCEGATSYTATRGVTITAPPVTNLVHAVAITGPATGTVETLYDFTAMVSLTVTATNAYGSAQATQTIAITAAVEKDFFIYVPIIMKNYEAS